MGKLRVSDGWKRVDKANAALILHPTGSFALGVLAGDSSTGNPDMEPRSVYPKGPVMSELMQGNDPYQFALFDAVVRPPLKLWFLVTKRIEVNGNTVVLREVSQPAPTHPGAIIEKWVDRIPLPLHEFGQLAGPAGPDDSDGPEEIDIRVGWR